VLTASAICGASWPPTVQSVASAPDPGVDRRAACLTADGQPATASWAPATLGASVPWAPTAVAAAAAVAGPGAFRGQSPDAGEEL
jgi:hypothetical protein